VVVAGCDTAVTGEVG